MCVSLLSNAIGGYFDLEIDRNGRSIYPDALEFNSGRSALGALMRVAKPARVWVPWYICNSVVSAFEYENINIKRYFLDENFLPLQPDTLRNGDCLLYINYFGICDGQVKEVLCRYPRDQVIIDFAQAFFAKPPSRCMGTIYSPRKFVGVPDGGYLVTDHPVEVVATDQTIEVDRIKHLLMRWERGAEAGYESYLAAEKSLAYEGPDGMSILAKRLLCRTDYEEMALTRRKNYEFIHRILGPYNCLDLPLNTPESPLSYPFWASEDVRAELISKKVYVATYWPEIMKVCDSDTREYLWAQNKHLNKIYLVF